MTEHDAGPLSVIAATEPAGRPALPNTWARYISGDFQGLYNLATDLYAFAAKSNSTVSKLIEHVNGNTTEWTGIVAESFRATFGQDAYIANGFGRTMSAAAGVLDTLAQQLAGLEQALEMELENYYSQGYIVHDGIGANGPSFKPSPQYSESSDPNDRNSIADLMQRIQDHHDAALVKADAYRNTAAAELLTIGSAISGAFNYYTNRSGRPGSLDRNGLLLTDQLASDQKSTTVLQKQLAAQIKSLSGSGINIDNVITDLQKKNADAQQIAEILSHMKGIKGATGLAGLIKKGGEAVEEVGPIVKNVEKLAKYAKRIPPG